ncbi:hypothetical protein ACFR9U_13795 [Halorientalis brevis]|uniref:Uncharacterized protein n=1 Tax=Halorientalis brevis TaxID=1126241 RepID=A0ABD6CDP3_9EURY
MNEAQQRVPQQMNDSMTLWRGLTLSDGLLFMPGAIAVLFSLVVIPQVLEMVGIVVPQAVVMAPGIVIGAVLTVVAAITLKTTPPHYKSTEWLQLHLGHLAQPSEYFHITTHYDHDHREQKDHADYDFVKSVWATNERTQDVLNIEQINPGGDEHDDTGYLQRPDSTILGAVRVYPANLSLATYGEWQNAVENFASVVNTLDFEIQIYRTTRELDIEQFLSSYQARRTHDDVRGDPELETLLENFLAWYPAELQSRGTQMIEYYVVVPVAEDEVTSSRRTRGVKDQIAEWPVISFFVDDDDDEEIPEPVLRGRQRETLYNRLETVKYQLKEIGDVDAERVSAVEHTEVLKRAYRQESEVDLSEQMQTRGVTMRAGHDQQTETES